MSVNVSPIDIITTVAGSLVAEKKFASIEQALWEIALSAVRNKTIYYRRRIRKFERKYATDFDTFTAKLKGRATPAEEDDWFEWRAVQSMLADWQQAYGDLISARPH